MSMPSTEMLREFVDIASPTNSEATFTEYLRDFLDAEFDYDHLELQEVEPGRANIIMVKGDPAVMLTSHLDTVPTAITSRVENGMLYGTGACDAKGQIAAQLGAIQLAKSEGLKDYGCFYVVGEEVDSIGARAAIQHPLVGGKYVLNGEPTDNRFVHRSKGVIEAVVWASGVECHSSMTPLDSAVHKLIPGLARLLEIPPPGSTVNIGLLKGGTAPNVSAASAEASVNLRISHPSSKVIEAARQLLGDKVETEILDTIEPFDFYVPLEHRANMVKVDYCSDAPYYAANFQKVMMFGPGYIGVAHSREEHVALLQVKDASRMMAKLLLQLQ